jgi:hypothetical protein
MPHRKGLTADFYRAGFYTCLRGLRGAVVVISEIDDARVNHARIKGVANSTGNTGPRTLYVSKGFLAEMCHGGFVKKKFFVDFFTFHKTPPLILLVFIRAVRFKNDASLPYLELK